MKPPPFEYHAPESVDEVLGLLGEYGDEAKVLAGGQSLVPLLSLRLAHPSQLIDINRVADQGSVTNGSGLQMGALVRHHSAAQSETVRLANPLFSRAAGLIGHRAIRNRGTVGGSLAHADPAAELPAVLLALGGEVEVRSARGARRIPAESLFEGFLMTSLEPDELLTTVHAPAWVPGAGWSFQEFSRRSGDFAIAGVATTLGLDGAGRIADVRIAFSGMGATPLRAPKAETALTGAVPSAELFKMAAQEGVADLDPPSDLHGSAAYRRHLASWLASRALEEAFGRAREGR